MNSEVDWSSCQILLHKTVCKLLAWRRKCIVLSYPFLNPRMVFSLELITAEPFWISAKIALRQIGVIVFIWNDETVFINLTEFEVAIAVRNKFSVDSV